MGLQHSSPNRVLIPTPKLLFMGFPFPLHILYAFKLSKTLGMRASDLSIDVCYCPSVQFPSN